MSEANDLVRQLGKHLEAVECVLTKARRIVIQLGYDPLLANEVSMVTLGLVRGQLIHAYEFVDLAAERVPQLISPKEKTDVKGG